MSPKLAPPALYGLSLVNVNDQIYLFGGYKETPTQEGPNAISLSNQLWHWVSEPDNWELITPIGGLPPARAFHSAAAANGKLYIFQGLGASGPLYDSWVYDPTTNIWTQLVTPSYPPARYYHSAASIGNCIFIFGGLDNLADVLNDLWCYDLNIKEWVQKKSLASSPHYGHSAVEANGKMVVWGGHRTTTLNELWAYDPVKDEWSQLLLNNPPPPSEFHAAVASGGKMWVFGGQSGSKVSNSVWEFEPFAAGGPSFHQLANMNMARYWFGAALLPPGSPQKVLLFGGKTGDGSSLANTSIYIIQDSPLTTIIPPPSSMPQLLLPLIRR